MTTLSNLCRFGPRSGALVLAGLGVVQAAFAQEPGASAAPDSSAAPAANGTASVPADASAAVKPAVVPSAPSAPTAAPHPIADSPEGDAKREYELGRLLYENGDYSGALVRFLSAAKTSTDPRLLWNAAVCEKALRHYARAIALMRRYLASNSPLLTAQAAASAQIFLAAAEPLTARLEVSVNVPDASVYADDEPVGKVPLSSHARIDWGTHQVVVKKKDFTDYEQTVTVSSSADVRVSAILRPVVHEGRIIVRAGSGDLIVIDGKPSAWGTWEGVLTSGLHDLRVSSGGSRPYEKRIVVADAQTRGFDITLEPAPRGSLPAWVWIAGGTLLAAGVATAGYFVFKPADTQDTVRGSIRTVQLGLH